MKRDRLTTVLGIRERDERQRLREHAAAEHARRDALRALDTARSRGTDGLPTPGAHVLANELGSHRVQAIALQDAVHRAELEHRAAERGTEHSRQRLVAASVRRRSVERLRDRRSDRTARDDARRDARRADEIALQVWRRS